MHNAGYDAILVGEALVVADDPALVLSKLVGRS
jgi:riboflavin biosynthesis pyrimidine reductase